MNRQYAADRIIDRIDELTRPYTHREPVTRYQSGTWITEPHIVQMPSLIDQLDEALTGGRSGTDRAGFESSSVARFDALGLLERMRVEATVWARPPSTRWRPTLPQLVRAPLGYLNDLGDLDVADLERDVRGWWSAARIVTTWDSPAMRIYAPCPLCEAWGDLFARVNPIAAWCRACGEAWDETNVGLLGDHVRIVNGEEVAS